MRAVLAFDQAGTDRRRERRISEAKPSEGLSVVILLQKKQKTPPAL